VNLAPAALELVLGAERQLCDELGALGLHVGIVRGAVGARKT
jgi:hypothetical protein